MLHLTSPDPTAVNNAVNLSNSLRKDLQDRVMFYLLNFLTLGGLHVGEKYMPSRLEKMLGPEPVRHPDQGPGG